MDTMKTDKKFPKTVYVKIENEGDEKDEFLNLAESVEEHAEIGEAVRVAVYERKEIVTVTTAITAS
jgi:hypothetical protein